MTSPCYYCGKTECGAGCPTVAVPGTPELDGAERKLSEMMREAVAVATTHYPESPATCNCDTCLRSAAGMSINGDRCASDRGVRIVCRSPEPERTSSGKPICNVYPTLADCEVYVNGELLTGVTAITWTARGGEPVTATIEVAGVEIDADAPVPKMLYATMRKDTKHVDKHVWLLNDRGNGLRPSRFIAGEDLEIGELATFHDDGLVYRCGPNDVARGVRVHPPKD